MAKYGLRCIEISSISESVFISPLSCVRAGNDELELICSCMNCVHCFFFTASLFILKMARNFSFSLFSSRLVDSWCLFVAGSWLIPWLTDLINARDLKWIKCDCYRSFPFSGFWQMSKTVPIINFERLFIVTIEKATSLRF